MEDSPEPKQDKPQVILQPAAASEPQGDGAQAEPPSSTSAAEQTQERRNKISFWVKTIYFCSGMFWLWAGSAFFIMAVVRLSKPPVGSVPTLGDLATIFFGASSLALIFFSLVTAVAALIQWRDLKAEIDKDIKASEAAQARIQVLEEKTEKKVQGLEKQLAARVNAAMGFMIGTIHSDPKEDGELTDKDRDYLAEAIDYCQTAYDTLKELEGNGKYMALNNLVYFSCVSGITPDSDPLEGGRELKNVGLRRQKSPHNIPYLLTFCRAMWTYSSEPGELREALSIVKNFEGRQLTNLQKKEAAKLAALLTSKIAELTRPAN
jgi:hypothetical protein